MGGTVVKAAERAGESHDILLVAVFVLTAASTLQTGIIHTHPGSGLAISPPYRGGRAGVSAGNCPHFETVSAVEVIVADVAILRSTLVKLVGAIHPCELVIAITGRRWGNLIHTGREGKNV